MSAPEVRRCIFELVNEWTDWLEARGISEHTIDSYWRYLLAAGRIAHKDPRAFSERDVVEVMSFYPAKGGGRAMVIRAMRSFFGWAEDIDVAEVLVNPARRIKVRQGALSIYFAVAKGDYPYELPLEAPEAIAAVTQLQALLDWKPKMAVARRPTLVGVGERSIWKWASDAGRAAGVHTFPHLLRHTMLSDLAQDPDVDQRTWIEAANHRDGSQIRRYAAASAPRIRAAMGRLSRETSPDPVGRSAPNES